MDQHAVERLGLEIFQKAEGRIPGIFRKDYWSGRVMQWCMQNRSFKIQMFRFVDALPYLTDDKILIQHLKEYFQADTEGDIPAVFKWGASGVGSLGLFNSIIAGIMRKNIKAMARIFITGEDAKAALPVLKKLLKNNIAFTIDILGEVALSEREALRYHLKYLELLDNLAHLDLRPPRHLVTAAWGKIPLINLSVKLSSIYSQASALSRTQSRQVLAERLRPIFDKAQKLHAFINLDMEHYGLKNLTLDVFKALLLQHPEFDQAGCVLQAYLKDAQADLTALIDFAKTHKRTLTLRLVKGAYWDMEVAQARSRGLPIPVFLKKEHTDANFEKLSKIIIDAYPTIRPAFGTHNIRSIAHAVCYARQKGLPDGALEFQMLYGMAEPIKQALAAMGYRIRDYTPVGDLLPGMAYLVRRLLENTSNESFLKQKFSDSEESGELLKEPQPGGAEPTLINPEFFVNAAILDFSQPHVFKNFSDAIKHLPLPLKAINYVNGAYTKGTGKIHKRENPSQFAVTVTEIEEFPLGRIQEVLAAGIQAERTWSKVPQTKRSAYLQKLADLIARDRYRLASVMVHEAGKAWDEADADVVEAMDFCRYYAEQALKLYTDQNCSAIPSENASLNYRLRGLSLVIAPWNFPLAILTGMSAAAVVTGNPVIMKPSGLGSGTASELVGLIHELGLPKGVWQCVYGPGASLAEQLSQAKDIKTICFTGSVPVGLRLLQQTGNQMEGQSHIKRVIVELGGKNAIIVDSDADLDEAVAGIITSAFGYQGQKCSACSRVILVRGNQDTFYKRLIAAADSIRIGSALDPDNKMGPVIDRESFLRITETIAAAKEEHTHLFGDFSDGSQGYFIGPHIFKVSDTRADLFQKEIFGPVLAITEVATIEQAVAVLNDVAYGLTGGVYSRLPSHMEYVRKNAAIGNLYINRGITGAIVARHPFGGKKMSGIGSKAGGPDYLHQFVDPITIVENTARKGFTPELLS